MSEKQQKERLSKRQLRREQLERKERQQRLITIGIVVVIALVVVAIIVVPTVQKLMNPAGKIVNIKPTSYPNEHGTTMGDANAKVKVEMFEDFQCPRCKEFSTQTEPLIIQQFVEPGKAYLVYYNFPILDRDPNFQDSHQAASAAECAADQNRFWDFKQLAYANSTEAAGSFSDARLTEFAKALGLDMNKFNACYTTNAHKDTIQQNLALGAKLSVTGTPTVLVNGKNVAPGMTPTFEQVQQAIQQALAGG